MTIIKHELKMNLKSLLIWAISVGFFCFLCIILYPSLEESLADMKEAYASMGSLTRAFGLDKIGLDTVMGFYATQIAPIYSLGGALFAAILGTTMLAKEEANHTAEFLFTLPLSRKKVVLQKLLGMLMILIMFNLLCCIINGVSFLLIEEAIEWKSFFLYHVAQVFMQIEIACICFMISSFTRKNSVGLGLGMAILFYASDMMAKIIPSLENIKYVTPFYYSDASEIMSSNNLDITLLAVGLGMAVVSLVIAFIYFRKKDLVS